MGVKNLGIYLFSYVDDLHGVEIVCCFPTDKPNSTKRSLADEFDKLEAIYSNEISVKIRLISSLTDNLNEYYSFFSMVSVCEEYLT